MADHRGEVDEQVGHLHDQLLAYARDLRGALERSRRVADELSRTHLETVAALAAAIDVRDEVTGGHVYRVANYGLILAGEMAPELAHDPQLVYGFLLHDIGKLGVPDRVLLKEGPLDEHEQDLMREHVQYGVKFVEQIAFLEPALHVIATHHEMWDGSGYPNGLRGEEIPLATRLFAVCDAFDAMIHDRPYREGMPVERALSILRGGSGRQWDPQVMEGFDAVLDEILEVGLRPDVPDVPTTIAPRQRRALTLEAPVVFDAVDDGLLVVDTDGVIQDANTPVLELFGLQRPPVGMTLAELVERTIDRYADGDDARERARSVTRELFSARSEATFRLVHPVTRTIRRVAHTIYGEGGEAVGRLLVFHDVAREEEPLDAARRALAALEDGDPDRARALLARFGPDRS